MATKPFSMKVENDEIQEYKRYASELGLPVSLFVKMVLKLYAKKVYESMKANKIT